MAYEPILDLRDTIHDATTYLREAMERAEVLYCASECDWEEMAFLRDFLRTIIGVMQEIIPPGIRKTIAQCEAGY